MDFGMQTLDEGYEPFQRQRDVYLERASYRRDTDWLTLKLDGADESERSWRERRRIPPSFLLGRGLYTKAISVSFCAAGDRRGLMDRVGLALAV